MSHHIFRLNNAGMVVLATQKVTDSIIILYSSSSH